jgi:tetratricopeptide (TPR) repeat protein
VGDRDRAREANLSLSLGTAASEDDDHVNALRYLAWAKHLAPRSAVVREALGIALYRSGDLRAALSELQAYRRMGGSNDQNHLIADCIRSEGREPERAIEVGTALITDASQDIERRVEAAIVVAAVHLAADHHGRASATLAPFLQGPDSRGVPVASTIRMLWVVADIAEAEGSDARAIAALERLQSLDPGYPDLADRLAGLRARDVR